MKLYIATTALNFDTIMSTESISPVSFYQYRRFGIPYMYDNASLRLHNSIILFDYIPTYELNRSEFDHRPLIVEVDTAYYPSNYFTKVKEGVYQTSKTLYLSPQSSSLLFLNYEDFTITMNKSDNIVETKSILYKKLGRIQVAKHDCTKLKREIFDGISDYDKIDEESLRKDIIINKAKGFLVGYLIGRKRSLSVESSRLLNVIRQIKNLIYSLSTKEGPDRSRIHNELRGLINEANHLSWTLDENKAKALSAVLNDLHNEGFNDEGIKIAQRYFTKRGLYPHLFNQLCPNTRLFNIEQSVLNAVNCTDDSDLDRKLKVLTDYTNSILQYMPESNALGSLIKFHPDLKIMDCLDSNIDDHSQKILSIIYNLLSDQNIRSEEFKSKRIGYIGEIAKTLRDSSEIDFQLIREYINGLLDNLEVAKPFDVTSSNFIAINSFGAFMKAPDADIDKLISMLVANEISNQRIALGLWGIIYGYSNIPNYYFRQWLEYADINEVQQYLHLVTTQIYGNYDFNGNKVSFAPSVPSQVECPSKHTSQEATANNAIKGKTNEQLSLFENSEEDSVQPNTDINKSQDRIAQPKVQLEAQGKHIHEVELINYPQENNEALEGWKAVVFQISSEILNNCKPVRTASNFMCYYTDEIMVAIKSCKGLSSVSSAIDHIQPIKEGKSAWDKARRKILKAIKDVEKSYVEKLNETMRLTEAEKLTSALSSSPLYDKDLWNNIVNLLPNDLALKEQFKKDLEWFINNYNDQYLEKGQWVQGRFKDRDKGNDAVLEHLREHLKGKKLNYKQDWLVKIYNSLSIEGIDRLITSLKYIYK